MKNVSGFKEQIKNDKVSIDGINETVLKSGGLSFTRMFAKKYYNRCLYIINSLDISEVKNKRLMSILEKEIGRAHV